MGFFQTWIHTFYSPYYIQDLNIMSQEDYDLEERESDQQFDHQAHGSSKLQLRMSNYRNHLGEKLEQMGLEIEVSPTKNHDPSLVVQQEIEQLTAHLIYRTEEVIEDQISLTQLLTKNEGLLGRYYQGVLAMAEVMESFSKQLYSAGEHISTFRNFKRLCDQFREYSLLLNEYTPFSEEFEKVQRRFTDTQISLLDKIVFKSEDTEPQTARENISEELELLREQNQQLKEVLRRYEEELSKYSPQAQDQEQQQEIHQENLKMMGEIENLQRVLNQNNQDFAVEIQRYNRLLHSEREQFKKLEIDLRSEARILEYSSRQIEKELSLCQEEKYKDQLVIENMIKKIRLMERGKPSLHMNPAYRANLNLSVGVATSPKRPMLQSVTFKRET